MRHPALAARGAIALVLGTWFLAGCELPGLLDPELALLQETSIEIQEDGQARFEGGVEAVQLDAGNVLLFDDVTIRVTDTTEIATDRELSNLEAVAHALEEGIAVVASGRGPVATDSPMVIVALELAFEIAGGHTVEFEGHIASIDTAASTVTFENGTTIEVADTTEISDDYQLPSLAAAHDALEAGNDVVAWGHGTLEGEDPVVIAAAKITFKVKEPAAVDFEGEVLAIAVDAGEVVFGDSTTVKVVDDTEISDDHGVASLEAAKEALDAGKDVVAWGHGPLESEDPRLIVAEKITFKAEDPSGTGG